MFLIICYFIGIMLSVIPILENLLPEYHGILAKLLSVYFVFSVLLIGIPSITCVLKWVVITISASLTDYKKYPDYITNTSISVKMINFKHHHFLLIP